MGRWYAETGAVSGGLCADETHAGWLEANPVGAVRTSGSSTRVVAHVAGGLGVRGFVLVSTDKAVAPEAVMGASKALAEFALEAATARLIAETCVEDIVGAAAGIAAHVLIVDSIQTMHSERVDSAPGAVSQLRECTAELVRFAKASGTAVLLVGHVTKEGQIAGPRVLEHMVDTVL